jgi:hypothetical protein
MRKLLSKNAAQKYGALISSMLYSFVFVSVATINSCNFSDRLRFIFNHGIFFPVPALKIAHGILL